MDARFAAKWKLIQLLYRRGWKKQRIIDLFAVVDWMIRLPDHLARELWQNIGMLEEEKQMRYVTTVERFEIEKRVQEELQQGLQEGVRQGLPLGIRQGEALALQRVLAKRFGDVPAEIAARIAAAPLEDIEGWLDRIFEARHLDDVFAPAAH